MKFLVKLCGDGESNNGDRVCRVTNTLHYCCYFSDMYQLVLWCQKTGFLNTNWNIEPQIYPLFLSNFMSERECNWFRKHFCRSINEHGLMQTERNCCHSFVPLVSIQVEVRCMWNYHTFIRQSGIYWDCKYDGGQMHKNGKTVHVNCCVCSPCKGSAFYIILPIDTRSQFL